MKRLIYLAAVAALSLPAPAFAWGSLGHRIIGSEAAKAFPREIPAFLRSQQSIEDIGEWSRERDRSKGFAKLHDGDGEPAHFVDLELDGTILGGPRLDALPPNRAAYEAALQAVGKDSWKAGFLPYAILDKYQELTTDFGYWRVLKAAEANPKWRKHRAWFTQDRRRREAKILVTLGDLGHYVGDGSQPMHVSSHYNGWGDYPNPKGYTTAKVHAPFEGAFVKRWGKAEDVAKLMPPMKTDERPVEDEVVAFLLTTGAQVEPYYQLEKDGGFAPNDPRGVAFANERLAAGAAELRDLVVRSWRRSATISVGWRPVKVEDVLAGKIDPYGALTGVD